MPSDRKTFSINLSGKNRDYLEEQSYKHDVGFSAMVRRLIEEARENGVEFDGS